MVSSGNGSGSRDRINLVWIPEGKGFLGFGGEDGFSQGFFFGPDPFLNCKLHDDMKNKPTACIGFVEDRLILFGGFYSNELLMFKIRDGLEITLREDIEVEGKGPSKRYASTMTSIDIGGIDGVGAKWVIFAGLTTNSVLNDLFVLEKTDDSDSLSWKQLVPASDVMPPPRGMHAAAFWNDQLIVCGGRGEGKVLLDDVWSYSLTEGVWEKKTSFPSGALASHGAVVIQESLLVVYGGLNENGDAVNDIQILNLATNTWCVVSGDEFPARAKMGMVVGENNDIWIHGGVDGNGKAQNTTFCIKVDVLDAVVKENAFRALMDGLESSVEQRLADAQSKLDLLVTKAEFLKLKESTDQIADDLETKMQLFVSAEEHLKVVQSLDDRMNNATEQVDRHIAQRLHNEREPRIEDELTVKDFQSQLSELNNTFEEIEEMLLHKKQDVNAVQDKLAQITDDWSSTYESMTKRMQDVEENTVGEEAFKEVVQLARDLQKTVHDLEIKATECGVENATRLEDQRKFTRFSLVAWVLLAIMMYFFK